MLPTFHTSFANVITLSKYSIYISCSTYVFYINLNLLWLGSNLHVLLECDLEHTISKISTLQFLFPIYLVPIIQSLFERQK